MKKPVTLLALLALTLSAPAIVQAQEDYKTITATVNEVNKDSKKITVTGPEGNKVEYTLTNDTQIKTRTGETLQVGDLKPGAQVKITYTGKGENARVTKVELQRGK